MTAPDKQELLPCPFCGNDGGGPIEDALHITGDEVGDGVAVQCDKCTATMGPSKYEVDAIADWNTRAKPKSGEVVPSIKFTTYTDGRGFRACLGDYDLDCHEGHGKAPLEAIQDLLNSHIDDLEE